MKVIFLDIDGVLNTRRGWSNRPKGWRYGLDRELYGKVVEIFEDFLVENPDVKIVLSSTWRRMPNWKSRLKKESLIIYNRIIDVTPILDKDRGLEIKDWMDRHPEVTKYAIIDDDSDMLDEQLPFFVHTTFKLGLTKAHIKHLEELL